VRVTAVTDVSLRTIRRIKREAENIAELGPYSPTPVKVNCRLKCFVTLVTYCYNNIFVYFNLQLTLTGVGEYGP
jgi:hypothetical protein